MGDLIERSDGLFLGVVTTWTFNGTNYIYNLANSNYTGGSMTANVRTTSNPPYNKDAFDIWGMYKSYINLGLIATNENLARKTTYHSSKSVIQKKIQKPTGMPLS